MIKASEADAPCRAALELLRRHRALHELLSSAKWHQYALSVIAGQEQAGAYERLACARYVRDICGMPGNGYQFYPGAAYHVIDFCASVNHVIGRWKGQPFIPDPWEEFVIANIFGFFQQDDDGVIVRRFIEAWIEVAKKNGKSFLASVLGLYCLLEDGEPQAQVYSGATSKEQAEVIWDMAGEIIQGSDRLHSRVRIKSDTYIDTFSRSEFRAVPKVLSASEGKNPHCVLLDEVHMHRSREIYDSFRTGMAARLQPLLIMTTTAGDHVASFGYERHKRAASLLRGTAGTHERQFAYIASPDEGDEDDWMNPKVWRKGNPNYGVAVKHSFLKSLADDARADPTGRNAFKRKNLNIWIKEGKIWLELTKWDACGRPEDHPPIDEWTGRPCHIGVDLASTLDLTCVMIEFDVDGIDYLYPYFFVPKNTVKVRSAVDRVPYEEWAEDGQIIATPGPVTDYDYVEDVIVEAGEKFDVQSVRYDPYNATMLIGRLAKKGLPCVKFRQGVLTMSEPTKEFEKAVTAKTIRHGGHPVLRWNASNVVVTSGRNDTYSPDKEKSLERIDGITAGVTGYSGIIADRADPGSIYEALLNQEE